MPLSTSEKKVKKAHGWPTPEKPPRNLCIFDSLGFHAAEGWNLLGGSRMDWKEELLETRGEPGGGWWNQDPVVNIWWLVSRTQMKRFSECSVSLSSSGVLLLHRLHFTNLASTPAHVKVYSWIHVSQFAPPQHIQLWHSNRYVFSRKSMEIYIEISCLTIYHYGHIPFKPTVFSKQKIFFFPGKKHIAPRHLSIHRILSEVVPQRISRSGRKEGFGLDGFFSIKMTFAWWFSRRDPF